MRLYRGDACVNLGEFNPQLLDSEFLAFHKRQGSSGDRFQHLC